MCKPSHFQFVPHHLACSHIQTHTHSPTHIYERLARMQIRAHEHTHTSLKQWGGGGGVYYNFKKLPEKIRPSHRVGITAQNQERLSSSKHLRGCLWGLIKSSTLVMMMMTVIIITAPDWGGVGNNDRSPYFPCVYLKRFCVLSQVTEIRLKYFDTIPVATAMCVLKTGFLFVCSEFGNQEVFCQH